eukprot:jgi/Mesen1/3188/ME000184S02252
MSKSPSLTKFSIANMWQDDMGEVQAASSISDVPDAVLERILRSACTICGVGYSRKQEISMSRVRSLSTVCPRWRDALLSSWQRAFCSSKNDAPRALKELCTLKNVTHVSIPLACQNQVTGRLLRGLARGFPLLTSFKLILNVRHEIFNSLSAFLSLRTNIQELTLEFDFVNYFEYVENARRRLWKALKALDFASQAHLKTLTLRHSFRSSYASQEFLGRCLPVSRTLAQLASLQELHVEVDYLTVSLPPWLAKLPALAGLKIDNFLGAPPPVVASVRSMTGLRALALGCKQAGAREMDLVSSMSQLTSLELCWSTAQDQLILGLSSTLRKMKITGGVIPRNARPLPFLEDLTLYVTKRIQRDYFAYTPSLRRLHMSLAKGVALPHLEGLSQLTYLALHLSEDVCNNDRDDSDDEDEDRGGDGEGNVRPGWRIRLAPLRALQRL